MPWFVAGLSGREAAAGSAPEPGLPLAPEGAPQLGAAPGASPLRRGGPLQRSPGSAPLRCWGEAAGFQCA